MQEIEIKFVLNDQEFKQKLNIDDAKLADLISGAKNIQLGYDTSLAKMKLSEVRTEQARLKAELAEKIKLDVDMASIGETKSKLQQVEEALEGIVKKEKEAGSASGNWSLNIMGINQGLELAKKAWEALSVPIAKAGQFEQYLTSMKVMLGTTQAAQDRLAELVDFAKSTPFELPQVVEAANQLQAIGRYSEETLRDLGDLASASGKPMEQALSAFAKMATGQKGVAVDMFRDLLISVDDWVAATGKGVTANGELQASTEEMLTALPQIIKEKNFAGMMEAQSATFNGAVSNMKDGFDQLLTSLGEKLLPSAKHMVTAINEIISSITPIESKFEKATESGSKLQNRFEELSFTVKRLGSQTKLSAVEQEVYNEAIDSLEKEYPKYFEKMDLHKAKQSDINVAIDNAKIALDKYIENLITAALIEDNEAIIKELGKKQREAQKLKDSAELEYNKGKEKGTLEKEDASIKQTNILAGNRLPVSTQHELLTSQRKYADKTLVETEKEITDLKKEIDELRKKLVDTTPPTEDKTDDKTGDKKPPTGGTTTKNDYYRESLQDIKQANQEEILQEKAKNQTLTQLYQQKKESEQALLQASINLNKDANSEKLKTEFETAKENYNISVKLYDDKINEEQKFQDKKTQLLQKIEQDNLREAFSHQLKNSTITQLDEQLLQAKIEKSMIEDAMKLTSDAQRYDTLEKERAATSEKIQLIQAEIDNKKEQINTIDEMIVKEQEKEFIDRARKLSMLELERGILEEEVNIQNIKFKLQQAKDAQEIAALKAEIDRSNTRKKTMLDEVNVRQQLVAKTMLQYSEQYNAQESFGRQSNRILNETVKNEIKAKIAEATATQISWVIELVPWPLNAVIAPLAGLAIGALFDTLVPKFEYGGYPEGKNAIVQVNEKGQEFIVNAKATAKYSDILEKMNAGIYQPSRPEYVSGDVYYPAQDNSGFVMLAEAIQEQTDRLESVERYVKVTELAEGLNNYQTQQSRIGY
jgi:hypothetical protein